jgi:hypothetical protein
MRNCAEASVTSTMEAALAAVPALPVATWEDIEAA